MGKYTDEDIRSFPKITCKIAADYLVPPEKVGVKREKHINEKGFPYLMSKL